MPHWTSSRAYYAAFFLILLTMACGYDSEPPAGDGVGATGSWWEPFTGSPPFPNLICCPDDSECSDGNDIYEGCYVPDSPNANGGLCFEEWPSRLWSAT